MENLIPTELILPPSRVVINRKQLKQKVPLCERTILEMEKRGVLPKEILCHAPVGGMGSGRD
jgi:hypothetical protein